MLPVPLSFQLPLMSSCVRLLIASFVMIPDAVCDQTANSLSLIFGICSSVSTIPRNCFFCTESSMSSVIFQISSL